jgi:hypothetical protein
VAGSWLFIGGLGVLILESLLERTPGNKEDIITIHNLN